MKQENCKMKRATGVVVLWVMTVAAYSQAQSSYQPDNTPEEIEGYKLVWHDEFNRGSRPDTSFWSYEYGFVRNRELQWYQPENAGIQGGILVIEGRRERLINEFYDSTSTDWRKNRSHAGYTSASINTRGKKSFRYGLFKVRARIDTARGMWPAIWTLGANKGRRWPANGEIDIMEFYRIGEAPHILANAAWADEKMQPVWDSEKVPFTHFLEQDPGWPEKFHEWTMEWTGQSIKLYLDNKLLNEIDLSNTQNADGFNPFHQPHYILLNLALGSNGGDPSHTRFPKQYEVDYVRVYQKK